MDKNKIYVGVDIEDVSRFVNKTMELNKRFLERVYTIKEIEYCFKDKKYAEHLAGKYCAKEATIKALNQLGYTNIQFNKIEVLNKDNGLPYINLADNPNLSENISLSISHTSTTAIAYVAILV